MWFGDFILESLYWGPCQREEVKHRKAAEEVIDFLEIQSIRRTPVGRLPYGLQKRVELGRALAMEPDLLLLDEPELGLHPAAIALIGDMIKSLATQRQIIVATQSPLLVDTFDLDEILVLDLVDGQTRFRTLDPGEYRLWLDECFTSGDLWQKNLIGGRP